MRAAAVHLLKSIHFNCYVTASTSKTEPSNAFASSINAGLFSQHFRVSSDELEETLHVDAIDHTASFNDGSNGLNTLKLRYRFGIGLV